MKRKHSRIAEAVTWRVDANVKIIIMQMKINECFCSSTTVAFVLTNCVFYPGLMMNKPNEPNIVLFIIRSHIGFNVITWGRFYLFVFFFLLKGKNNACVRFFFNSILDFIFQQCTTFSALKSFCEVII